MGSGPVRTDGASHPAEARKVKSVFYQGVASSTRTKTPPKGAKGKSGRRLPPKVKTGPELPLLPVVVAGLLVVLFVGLVIYYYVNTRPVTVAAAGGIPCDQLEHSQTHYHAVLQIIHEGNPTPLPGGIGIQGGESSPTCFYSLHGHFAHHDVIQIIREANPTPLPGGIGIQGGESSPTCCYWLHVHSANQNVIHIESPANDTFTLSQFFAVWNAWSTNKGGPKEPLSATQVSSFTLTPDEKLYVYIDLSDGKGPQLFTGDPGTIVLKAHEVISLEIASGPATPPPGFDWTPTGL